MPSRGGLLAALGAFLLIHHGHGRTIVVFSQGHRADDAADHFAVQTQGRRRGASVLSQPAIDGHRQDRRVQAPEQIVEDLVIGHFAEAGVPFLIGKAKAARCLGCRRVAKPAIWATLLAPESRARVTRVSSGA